MKKSLREFVLSHFITRELFFIVKHKKVNIRKIDRKIKALKVGGRPVTTGLIVSLTSYGERLKELKYTLFSLVTQSINPERIVVNIAEKDMANINQDLLVFEKFGVEYNYCEDLRSYKKLIPTLQKYPDKVIVTADDDLYFSKRWLEKLWNEHLLYPNDIICHLAYKITFNDNQLNPYQKWIHNAKIKDYDNAIFLLGGAGCLYPPNSLIKDVLRKDIFSDICPYADDMWFYFMAVLNKTRIRQVQQNPELNLCYTNPYREYGIIDGATLTNINVNEGQNDKQFMAILDYYCITPSKYIDFLKGKIFILFSSYGICDIMLIDKSYE